MPSGSHVRDFCIMDSWTKLWMYKLLKIQYNTINRSALYQAALRRLVIEYFSVPEHPVVSYSSRNSMNMSKYTNPFLLKQFCQEMCSYYKCTGCCFTLKVNSSFCHVLHSYKFIVRKHPKFPYAIYCSLKDIVFFLDLRERAAFLFLS